jgi:hypothetical protein
MTENRIEPRITSKHRVMHFELRNLKKKKYLIYKKYYCHFHKRPFITTYMNKSKKTLFEIENLFKHSFGID